MTTRPRFVLLVIATAALLPRLGWAVSPAPEEMAESRHWAAARFEGRQDAEPPGTDRPMRDDEPFFSFRYDGKPSAEVLKTWKCQRSNRVLDDQRTEFTIVYTDPTTGLALRLVGVEYRDFPVVEWTVYFKNAGQQNTPILEDIQALDLRLERATDGEFVLHGIKGDFYSADSYRALSARTRLPAR